MVIRSNVVRNAMKYCVSVQYEATRSNAGQSDVICYCTVIALYIVKYMILFKM